MSAIEIIIALLGVTLGSGGIVTVYISAKLKRAEKDAEGDRVFRREMQKADRRWRRALGRTLFWIMKKITGCDDPNGDLDRAFNDFNQAEEDLKTLERDRMADIMNE